MLNFVIGAECFAICLTFLALILLLHGSGAQEQKLLIFAMCGSLVQNIGYLLEILAPNVEAAVTSVSVENVGSAFVPLCYCWFIYLYCYATPPKVFLRTIAVISGLIIPAVFFNWHGIFYKEIDWLTNAQGFHYIRIEYGPLYYVFLVTRVIIPFVLCMYTLAQAIRLRSGNEVNRQYWTILAFSSIPVAFLFLYVFKATGEYDLTPLSLAVAMSLVVIMIWSRRNYDFRFLAADKVLDSISDGVIAVDNQDRFISYNRAAERIFNTLPFHKLGENIHELENFEDEMMDEKKPYSFSIGGQHYESHAKQILDENGVKQGCVILLLDMTNVKTYINEIKRVRQQAEKANVAKSEFLANMSHEIRTPMNAIIGLNDIIMEECKDEHIYAHAKDVKSAAKNLLAIINDILDLSKVEAGKMELIKNDYHLKTVTSEVVAMMDMAASKRGLVMKFEIDESLPCCYSGDEGRIKQILINILNNAIKFTRAGYVKISVTGSRAPEVDGVELLTFCVEDTGCGIKQADLTKIFDDFKQVDAKKNRSVEGTGLGLAIVKHLVELMHGSIDIKSEYGVGTTIWVNIPQTIVDARPIAEVPELLPTEQEGGCAFKAPGLKVLVVDDNSVNRKVAKGFLKNYNFDLYEAESGPDAIEMVRDTKFDIIFMDHMMPQMDGIETVEIIRRDLGKNGVTPIIIALTANAMEGMKKLFLEHGFQDFIAKPLDRKELNKLLYRWVPEDKRMDAASSDDDTTDLSSFEIPGIDTVEAAKYCGADEDNFMELLELYCADGQRKAGLLAELAQTDIPTYQIEVHALKSASANIGAKHVSALAKEQEFAAAAGDTKTINEKFPELLSSYTEQLKNIGKFLESKKDTKAQKKLPPLPQTELLDLLTSAYESLCGFKSKQCAQIVEEVLSHELNGDINGSVEEIMGQLKLFEDDNAEELLKRLINKLQRKAG